MPPKFNINAKTIVAPLAAFTMATILFVYSRTSIQAAKRNAQRHREADGGQINWHNESLRRHGVLESPVKEGTVGELVGTLQATREERRREKSEEPKVIEETEAEKVLRERTGKGRG